MVGAAGLGARRVGRGARVTVRFPARPRSTHGPLVSRRRLRLIRVHRAARAVGVLVPRGRRASRGVRRRGRASRHARDRAGGSRRRLRRRPAGSRRRDSGLKPLVGSELTLADGSRLPLLVEDREGYRNLCRLITRLKLGAPKGSASLAPGHLEPYTAGLVCLTGGARGPLARLAAGDRDAATREILDRLVGHLRARRLLRRGAAPSRARARSGCSQRLVRSPARPGCRCSRPTSRSTRGRGAAAGRRLHVHSREDRSRSRRPPAHRRTASAR